MSGFKMNPNFERDLKRDLQKKLDGVYNQYKGRPVAEVKTALKRIGLNEPTITQLGTAISEGKKPRVE